MNLYLVRYQWPDGRNSAVTLAAPASQILARSADYVRAFVGGELLSITEERAVVRVPQQLTLEG